MHLIEALACGIRGAELGYVELWRRGTSTPATYYTTFEATSGVNSDIALDSYGAAVVYVNQLVDVNVYTANGTLVRSFTAGSAAGNVEYQGQSFTGANYETGSTGAGAGYATTLQDVLDSWKDSAGATDFEVLVDGEVLSLSEAVAPSGVFNVKADRFGATGNGVTDDTAAIVAAIAAADGRGEVYFPKGSYVCSSSLAITDGVTLRGAGPGASFLLFTTGTSTACIDVTTTGVAAVRDLYISCATNGGVVSGIKKSSSGRLIVDNVSIAGAYVDKSLHVTGSGSVLLRGSSLLQAVTTSQGYGIYHAGTGTVVANGNRVLVGTTLQGYGVGVTSTGSAVITGNTFELSAGTTPYVFLMSGTPTTWVEQGNAFSGSWTGAYSLSSKPSGLTVFGARKDRVYSATDNSATITLSTENYDTFRISRTSSAAQTIQWDASTTPDGIEFTVIYTQTGASATMTWGTGFVTTSATFTVGAGLYDVYHFRVHSSRAHLIGGDEATVR